MVAAPNWYLTTLDLPLITGEGRRRIGHHQHAASGNPHDDDRWVCMTTTFNARSHSRFDGCAPFINATLKRSPELSHTDGLIERSRGSCVSMASRSTLCAQLTMT